MMLTIDSCYCIAMIILLCNLMVCAYTANDCIPSE